ncbi:substrate-binding domain-containing protein, partial [Klebsiella pneumoniae]
LTTINHPRDEIGRHAMLLLLEQLQGNSVTPGSRLLDSDLIIRESTKAPKS